jgi:uncharacterized glyoxalase superfamily protein PhnB
VVDVPVYAEFRLPDGMRVGVYERRGFGRNTGEVPLCAPDGALLPCELYLYADDPVALCARVQSAGGRLLSALTPRDWGDEVAYLADPCGNVLAVARASAPRA